MSSASSASVNSVRAWMARCRQLIGWAGVVGTCLLMVAFAIAGVAWSSQSVFMSSPERHEVIAVAMPDLATSLPTPSRALAQPPELPRPDEVPLLLTQMEHAAVTHGLAWRAADYRFTLATAAAPATLEVRCSIKGPYPKLRGMLVQLLGSVPVLSIREFALSRPSSDSTEVEAKLVLAVFLLGDVSTAGAWPAQVKP